MTAFLTTRATDLLGCSLPIVLAGMGGVARSELVAAVTTSGAFGFLGMVREPVALIRREVEALRGLGHVNFGVNIIPAATEPVLLDRQVGALIELRVPVVSLFWDLNVALVRRFRDAGITVVYQAGSAEEATAAEAAGAQLIVAQGIEAGGHIRGTTRLCELLPRVRKAVGVPVLAAGGLATGGDLIAAQALGADGIVLGTTLAVAEESFAHRYHKQRLVGARARDTLLTKVFHINWPAGANVRVLGSHVTSGERGQGRAEMRQVIGEEDGRPIYLFGTDSPLRSTTGELESMALYAGTGIDRITTIRPAAEIIREIVASADFIPTGSDNILPSVAPLASPVCYLGEMAGSYIGQLETFEVAHELATLLLELQTLLRDFAEEDARSSTDDRPPFSTRVLGLARWVVGLNSAAISDLAGSGQPASRVEASGQALDHLRNLIPRLPDNALRSELVSLRVWLEAVLR